MRESAASRIRYFRDHVLGLTIIVAVVFGGFALADLITRLLPLPRAYAYPMALCIGLAPFWWLGNRVVSGCVDWLEYLAICSILVGLAGFQEVFGLHLHAAWDGLAIVGAYWAYSIIRKRFGSHVGVPNESSDQDEDSR